MEEKLSAFAANQNDLLSCLQERLQQTQSCLEEMLTTGEAQISPVFVDNVDKSVDFTEKVKDCTVDKNVDETSDRLLSGVGCRFSSVRRHRLRGLSYRQALPFYLTFLHLT